ncbi:MAG: GNAT family N-acetyltransferase [Phycisphaeraceae bacterium]|nr:GNAT family N-acetyltransferase [Phycisphaeraceae bacterium]
MTAAAVVRDATDADVPAILPMVRAICAMHESLDPARYAMRPNVAMMYESWLPERIADPESALLVVEQDSKIAGFLVATTERSIPIYRLARFGFIHDVWVEPHARGKGLGKLLALRAIEKFRRIGVEQIRLETAAQNPAARKLFESCGFCVATIDMLLELR